MTENSFKKYYLFGIAMLQLQLIGYNVVSLGILAVSILPIISGNTFLNCIKTIPIYFYFLLFSITIGIYFSISKGLKTHNVMYWGQFYFFSFVLMAIRSKKYALSIIKYCVYIIYIGDIFTNILLLFGIDVPWSVLPPVREGESMARFTGIKGNTLYSGSISFIALCFMFQEELKSKFKKYFCLLSMIFNLALSGSYRYFIICAVVIALYYFHLYKHRAILFLAYIGSIIIVYFSTKITMFISASNFSRYLIWQHFFKEIEKNPLIGHGYFNMYLEEMQDFTWTHLIANGVTESSIILIAYCFGLPMLIIYLLSFATTLNRYIHYPKYMTELGLFIGLTLDLFWGGSFDNSLSFSALTLSLYLINEVGYYKQQPSIEEKEI